MKIVIIVPILEPDDIFYNQIIPKLKNQTIENELVLINSGKPIESKDLYEVINIDKNNFNHANTRNIALKYPADYYLFMTQDATPYDNTLIENLLKPFEKDENIVVAYARQIPYKDAYITEVFSRNFNYPLHSFRKSKLDLADMGIKTYFSSNSCAIYKGTYFKEKEGFKKDLNTSEDMEYAARAIEDDKTIAYAAQAKVYHSHNYTFSSLLKRYYQIGLFFKNNSWIEKSIENFASTEQSGKTFVIKECNYVRKKQPLALIKFVLFTLAKYLGYKIGKHY